MDNRPSFVRLDVLEFFRWVDDHKDDLSIAVSNLAKCLMLGKADEGSFARKLLDEANEFRSKKSEAGRKGMEARWGNSQDAVNGNATDDHKARPSCNTLGSGKPARGAAAKPPLRNRCPRDKLDFETFIYDPINNINTALAWEWYDIHKDRGWTDKAGAPLTNWKGALINYCKAKEAEQ